MCINASVHIKKKSGKKPSDLVPPLQFSITDLYDLAS